MVSRATLFDAVVRVDLDAARAVRDAMFESLRATYDAVILRCMEVQFAQCDGDAERTIAACLFALASEHYVVSAARKLGICATDARAFDMFMRDVRAHAQSVASGSLRGATTDVDFATFRRACAVSFVLTFGVVHAQQSDEREDCEREFHDQALHRVVRAGAPYGKEHIDVAPPKPSVAINKLYIVNFVATFDLGCTVFVKDLTRSEPLVLSRALQGAKFRFAYPSATCSVFCSGRAVVVGARAASHALLAAWQSVEMLRARGYATATVTNFRYSNITSTICLDGAFDMLAYYADLTDISKIKLAIENFPGIIISVPKFDTCILGFRQGRLNVIGCREARIARETMRHVLPQLAPYVRRTPEDIRAVFAGTQAKRSRRAASRDDILAALDDADAALTA